MKPNRLYRLSGLSLLFFLLIIRSSSPADLIIREGWNFSNTQSEDWKATRGTGALDVLSDRISLSLPANQTNTWIATVEPIWIYRYSQTVIRYQAHGVVASPTLSLITLLPGSIGPVTPGAGNLENPLARAGSAELIKGPEWQCDGEIHEFTINVKPLIRTEQIDQIIISAQTGDQPGSLDILDFSFQKPRPASPQSVFSTQLLQPRTVPNKDMQIQPIPIPKTDLLFSDIDPDCKLDNRDIQCAAIPFQLNENLSILATSIPDRGTITLEVNEKGSQFYLLMALNIAGTDQTFHFSPRTSITQPERLLITKLYADGTRDQSFPYNVSHQAYIVDATMDAYVIPLNPAKVLQSVQIEERMSYGQVFLAAVGILKTGTPPMVIADPCYPISLALADISATTSTPSLIVENQRNFWLENDLYRMEFTTNHGLVLSSLFYKPFHRNLLLQPTSLFSLSVNGEPIPTASIKLESYQANGNQLQFTLAQKIDSPVKIILQITPNEVSTLSVGCRIENHGYTPQSIRLRFPDLRGIRLSDKSEDDIYLFPLRQAAWSNEPTTLNGVHSGEFPLQFMDVYSESQRFGIAVHTQDTQPVLKRFEYDKNSHGSRLDVAYGFLQPIVVAPQQAFVTPPALIQLHPGDWKAPFQTYQMWAKQKLPSQSPAREVLRKVFICRRDYPIGGTGYLFDPLRHSYTFPRLIDESREDLGGVDMIDISGWAYSEKYGRVGEYDRFELGGKTNLHQGIEESRKLNVPVGLYFEGYLIDPRSTVGKQHGKDWQIIQADGTRKQWTGNEEMFQCSYCQGWRDFLSSTLLQTVQATGADAVYLDQYGFADASKICWSPQHGHEIGAHPLIGETEMLKQVRETLNRAAHPTALYCEQVPNDIAAQWVDAAFHYGVPKSREASYPTNLPLFRYAFPTFKMIELFCPGIDPRSVSEEDAKLCLFHGQAMWLKGRARSWYSREFREFVHKADLIFHQHEAAFTSENVEPLLPTEQRGIFANRFSGNTEEVITLYNAGYHTIRGTVISLAAAPDNIRDIWGLSEFRIHTIPAGVQIACELEPHGVGCVVFAKK